MCRFQMGSGTFPKTNTEMPKYPADAIMKTLKFVSCFSVAAAALACSLAWTTSAKAGDDSSGAAPKLVATVEGISEYHLDNGLRVLLFPDASQSKVTVNLTALVGSRQEGYGETGMAHLLEHMAFQGHAAPSENPQGTARTRRPVQWQHV